MSRVYIAASADSIRRNGVIGALTLAGHDLFINQDIAALRRVDAAVFVHPSNETTILEFGVAIGAKRKILMLLHGDEDRMLRLLVYRCVDRVCETMDDVVVALAPPRSLNDPPDAPIDHAPEECE